MTCFGLKQGQDLENKAHPGSPPLSEFQGVPPGLALNILFQNDRKFSQLILSIIPLVLLQSIFTPGQQLFQWNKRKFYGKSIIEKGSIPQLPQHWFRTPTWPPFHQADLATERERQLTTARTNQTTGLTNGRATNWAPEVEFSRFSRAFPRRQMTFAFCC